MWGNAAVGKRRESSGSGLDGRMVGREGMYLRAVWETREAIICDAGEACRLLLANQTIYTISSWRWAGRRVRTPQKKMKMMIMMILCKAAGKDGGWKMKDGDADCNDIDRDC